jgi:dolichol-phosphate mannosyltransferase
LPDLSVVVPVCNEAPALEELHRRLASALDALEIRFEVIFVNDGSTDESLAILSEVHTRDPRFKIVDFSRNFGQQLAVTAGIDHATGKAVVVMDGDLQDPPEILPKLIERWKEGYEVVYAVRRRSVEEPFLKRVAYASFYRLLRRIAEVEIPLDSGDFALMDRRVVDMLRSMPERNRYVRGLRAWVGFRQIGVEYERASRSAGETKYNWRGLLRLAYDGIFSFSEAPLRLTRDIGFIITLFAGLLGLWTLVKRLLLYEVVPGFATLAILVLFFGGVQLLTVGVLGEYIARIYTEVKARPRYVLRELRGVEPTRERYGLPRDSSK